MAQFFATLASFKSHLGGSVNQSLELESVAPVIADTAERHLLPYLGQSYYDDLLADFEDDMLSPVEEKLVEKLQRALALLTMYEYLPVAAVQVSEAGVFRVETDSHKAAFRYQEAQLRAYFLEKGYEALEAMLVYMADNRASLTTWRDGAEGTAYLSTLLNRVGDFRVYYGSNLSRYTFECMRQAVRVVEYHAVRCQVPAGFWSAFQTKYLAGTLTASEKSLLALWREAVAHYAAELAMRYGIVEYRYGRLVETFVGVEQGTVSQKQPALNDASVKNWLHYALGQSRTGVWKSFLVEAKADFPLVFDVASGGTSTATDAWHINTADEAAEAEAARIETNKASAVVRF